MSARYAVTAFRSEEVARAACDFYADDPVVGSGRVLLVIAFDDGRVQRSLHPWSVEAHQIGQAAVIVAGGVAA